MLDFRNALEIKHLHDSVFTDYKKEGMDFSRDNFTITLETDDYLYIGFHKPINSVYVHSITPNTGSGSITGEYWNGTSFTSLSEFYDSTLNLNRDGFITWRRNQRNETETIIDSTPAFWYRFSTSNTTSAIVFRAINILFCDDQSLKLKFNKILESEFLDGNTTHNLVHAGVRDDIVETLRRRGYVKLDNKSSDGKTLLSIAYANITPWDLLDIYEIREAACYLALSRIFFDFSDNPDDIWMKKSIAYENLYKQNINVARLSVDENDDGKVSPSENIPESKTTYITR